MDIDALAEALGLDQCRRLRANSSPSPRAKGSSRRWRHCSGPRAGARLHLRRATRAAALAARAGTRRSRYGADTALRVAAWQGYTDDQGRDEEAGAGTPNPNPNPNQLEQVPLPAPTRCTLHAALACASRHPLSSTLHRRPAPRSHPPPPSTAALHRRLRRPRRPVDRCTCRVAGRARG